MYQKWFVAPIHGAKQLVGVPQSVRSGARGDYLLRSAAPFLVVEKAAGVSNGGNDAKEVSNDRVEASVHGGRNRTSAFSSRVEGDGMTGVQLWSSYKAMLQEESGIDMRLVEQRGCRTVETKAELEKLGFRRAQRNVPGLLFPVYGPSGEIVLFQFRPDEPRIDKRGKLVKYETTSGSRMVLDVHPAIRTKLGDPSVLGEGVSVEPHL